MLISRRFLIAGASLALLAGNARAQTAENYRTLLQGMLGKPWRGVGSTPNEYIQGGKFVVSLTYHFTLNDDMSVSGMHDTVISLGGVQYTATFVFQGTVWVDGDAVGLDLEDGDLQSADSLPDNFYWQGFRGRLRILNNSDQAGSYVMSGTLTGQRSGDDYEVKIAD